CALTLALRSDRRLLGAGPRPRPALPVARLVDDDAVDPGAEAGMPPECVDGPEHPQEDFLREIERLVVVVQQVERQLIDHPLMLADELSAGVFVARRASLDERGFPAADVGP